MNNSLSRNAEGVLILIGLRGGTATRLEIEDEVRRLGLFDMTDIEYETWKKSVQPELKRQYYLAVERGDAQ